MKKNAQNMKRAKAVRDTLDAALCGGKSLDKIKR
jgi:hypothetical protein